MSGYTTQIHGQTLTLTTNDTVFSPAALDGGTAAMLSAVSFCPEDKVLDLGCGCGVVGILAARLISPERVTLCDISEDALALSAANAAGNGVQGVKILKSDGLSSVTDADYTKILSNPPYHTDFSVAKNFIEQGFRHLAPGGHFYMVTKRRDWYKNKLIAVFGGVKIDEINGYYVFTAQKRNARPANLRKKEQKKEKAAFNKPLSRKLARKKARRQ